MGKTWHSHLSEYLAGLTPILPLSPEYSLRGTVDQGVVIVELCFSVTGVSSYVLP